LSPPERPSLPARSTAAIWALAHHQFGKRDDLDCAKEEPLSVPLRSAANKDSEFNSFVENFVAAKLETPIRWRRFESLVSRNPVFWAMVGMAVGLLGKYLWDKLAG